MDEVRDTSREVAASYTFDIKVLDKDGKELQPADDSHVHVSFKTQEVTEELCQTEVYHIEDVAAPEPEQLEVVERGDVAVAEAEGFSTYTIVFSYEGITYNMPRDSITLDMLMAEIELHGTIYNVTSSDTTKLDVSGPGPSASGGSNADQWNITALSQIEDANAVILTIHLYNRPEYRVTVSRTGAAENHSVILLHMDGHVVTTANPARASEMIEVYVTGYTESQRKNLTYQYKGTVPLSKIPFFATSKITTAIPKITDIVSADGTQTREPDAKYNRFLCQGYTNADYQKYNQNDTGELTGGRWITLMSNTACNLSSITVTIKDGNTPICTNQQLGISLGSASLNSDLEVAQRSLHPVVIRVGETSGNLVDKLQSAGISHLTGCNAAPGPTLTANAPEGITITTTDKNSTTVTGVTAGHYTVDFILKKNDCAYHKRLEGTVAFDIYVLNTVTGEKVGSAVQLFDTNEWCTYTLKKTVDGVTSILGTYTYDQLRSMDDKIPLSGRGEYEIYETVTGINFIEDEDKREVKVRGKGDTDLVVNITHEHSWSYDQKSGDPSTLVATCGGTDGTCDITSGKELTISAPSDCTYTGEAKAATLNAYNTTAFPGDNTIIYYNADENGVKQGNALSGAPTQAGNYVAEVTVGTGNNAKTATKAFTISPKTLSEQDLANIVVTMDPKPLIYDGTAKEPSVSEVKLSDDTKLTYTVAYSNNTNACLADANNAPTATITLTGNYAGTVSKTFDIGQKEVGLTWTDTDLTYTGAPQAPTATATGTVGSDTCSVTLTAESSKTDKGTYTAEAASLSNPNYKLPAEKTTSFSIKAQTLSNDDLACVQVTLASGDQTYDGSEKKPTVESVTLGDKTFVKDTDYTVSYNNNVNAGDAAKVIITFTGNYDGTKEQTFTIGKAAPAADNFTFAGPSDCTYNAAAKAASVVAATGFNGMGNVTVKYYSDAARTQEVQNPTAVGTYYVGVVVAEGSNYIASTSPIFKDDWSFTIVPKALAGDGKATVTLDKSSVTYNGQDQALSIANGITVKDGAQTISSNDYTIEYYKDGQKVNEVKDAGAYTVKVVFNAGGNYAGSDSVEQPFTIAAKELTGDDVALSATSFPYDPDKNDQKPTVTVTSKLDGTTETSVNSTDGYTAVITNSKGETVENPMEADTYTVTVTGIGNYSGTVSKTFTIAAQTLSKDGLTSDNGPSSVTGGLIYNTEDQKLVAAPEADKVPTGYKIQYKQANGSWGDAIPTGKDASKDNVPYIVEYKYTALTSNYTDLEDPSFKIEVAIAKADLSEATVAVNPASEVFDGDEKTPAVTVTLKSGKELSDNEYEVVITDAKGNKVEKPQAATGYTYTVKAKGDNVSGEKTASYSITAQSVNTNGVTVTFEPSDANKLTYTGQRQVPAPGTQAKVVVNGKTLTEGTDYEVVYPDDSTNAGTYTAKIVFKGNYVNADSAEITGTYTISPAPLTITPKNQVISHNESIVENDTSKVDVQGLVNGDALTGIKLVAGASTEEGNNNGVVTKITASDAQTTNGILNYQVTYTEGTLIIKAAQDAPSDADKNGLIKEQKTTSIIINTKSGYEYVITTSPTAPADDADWSTVATPASDNTGYHKAQTDGTHEFKGLTEGTAYYVHMRKAAVEPGADSDPQTGADPSPSVIVPTSTRPEPLDGQDPSAILDIDYVNETVTPKSDSEAKKDGQPDTAYTSGSISIDPGDKLQVRVAGKTVDGKAVAPSNAVDTILPARPAAPAAVVETTGNGNQITKTDTEIIIKPTVQGQQYIVLPKGQVPTKDDWLDANKTQSGDPDNALSFTGLTAGTEYDVYTRAAAVAPAEGVSPAFASKNAGPTTVKTKTESAVLTADDLNKLTTPWNKDEADPTKIVVHGTVGYEYLVLPAGTALTDADWSKASKCTNGSDSAFDANKTKTFEADSKGAPLAPNKDYKIYVRKYETDEAMPSQSVEFAAYTTSDAPEAKEGTNYTVDYVNEKVAARDGYEIRKVVDGQGANDAWTDGSIEAKPGEIYQVRKKEVKDDDGKVTSHESEATEFTLKPRQSVTAVAHDANKDDIAESDKSIIVSPTTSGQQYMVVPADATDAQIEDAWTTVSTNENIKTSTGAFLSFNKDANGTPLAADTQYKVVTRTPAKSDEFKSVNAITVFTTKRSAPGEDVTKDLVKSQTTTSITIKATKDYEYVLTTDPTAPADEDWSKVTDAAGYYKAAENGEHTFSELESGKQYYVHVRHVATDDKEPSVPATVLTSTRMGDVTPTEGESHSFNYEDETVTAEVGYLIRRKGEGEDKWVSGPLTFSPGEKFEVKKVGTYDESGKEIIADSAPAPFNAPTRGAAPDVATVAPKDDTSFIINTSGAGQEYVVLPAKDATGNPITYTKEQVDAAFKAAVADQTKRIEGTGADLAVSKDSNGEALKPGIDYVVYNRTAAVSEHDPKSIASEYAGPKDVKTKTSSADLSNEEKDALKDTWNDKTANPKTIVVNGKEGYEYLVLPKDAAGDPDWSRATKFTENGTKEFTKDSAGDKITENTDYVILARKSATDDAMPSTPADPIPAYTTQKAPKDGEGYTVDYPGETIHADGGYEIRKQGSDEWSASLKAEPGTTYEVRKKAVIEGDGSDAVVTSHESMPTAFTLADRPQAVPAPAATTTDTTLSVKPTVKGQEYVVVKKGAMPTDEDWQNAQTSKKGEELTFTGLDADTAYEIVTRVPATKDSFKSENANTDATTKRSAPNVSDEGLIDDQCANTITINTAKGYEYVLTDSPNAPAGVWSGTAHYYAETENDTGTHTFGADPEAALEAGKQYYVHVREVAVPETTDTETGLTTPAKDPSMPTTVPTSTREDIAKGEGYEFDYKDETVKAEDGYLIRRTREGDDKWVSGPLPFEPGEEFEVKKLGENGGADSEPMPFKAPTRPSAPAPVDNVDKTDTSITVKPTQKNQEYIVLPAKPNGEAYTKDEIEDAFKNGGTPGTGTDITFTKDSKGNPLEAGTNYVVYNRIQAQNTGEGKALASESAGPTAVTTKRSTAPLSNEEKAALDNTWNSDDAKAHSILVHGQEGYEYLVLPKPADANKADWSKATPYSEFNADGTKEFTKDSNGSAIKDNTDYEILVRKAETDDALPSEPMSVPAYTAQEKPGEGEGYKTDYPAETIEVEDGYEIRVITPEGTVPALEPSTWTEGTPDENGKKTVPLIPGATYEIRKKESYPEATDHASEPATFTTNERPAAPEPIQDPKVGDKSITVKPSEKDQEYIVLPAKDAEGNPITYTPEQIDEAFKKGAVAGTGKDLKLTSDPDGKPLEQGTEYVVYNRVKATDDTPHSNPASTAVKTQTSQEAPDTTSVIKGKTSNSITVNTEPGCEYVVTTSEVPPTDEDWSKAESNGYYKETGSQPSTHRFSGLDAGTTYYVHVRKAETTEPAPGSAASPTKTVSTNTQNATPTGEPNVKQVNTTSVVVGAKAGEEYVVLPVKKDANGQTIAYKQEQIKNALDKKGTKSESGSDLTLSTDADGKDLVPGTDYVVYGRAAGTDTGDPSDPSEPASFTTLKENVDPNGLTDKNKPTPADKPVYSGAEQPLVTGPTERPAGTTGVQYSTDGGTTWSESIPAGTDAGDYDVLVKYMGDAQHNDLVLDDPIHVTIAKRPVTFVGTSATKAYNGSKQTVSGYATKGEGLVPDQEATLTHVAEGTAAGTYTGTITAKDKVKITAGNEDVTKNYQITTEPGKLTIRSLKVADDGTGTGKGILTDEDGNPVDEGGNPLVKDEDGNYYPAKTDPETGNPVPDKEQGKKQPVNAITAKGSNGDEAPEYDGKPHTPELVDETQKDEQGNPKKLDEGKDFDVAYYKAEDVNPDGSVKQGAKPVTPEEAGDKVAVITLKGNYDGNIVVPADIKKADSKVDPAGEGATGLVWNGKQQRLLSTLPKTSDGTLMYSVDGGNWTAEAPKALNAGDHTVKYMVVGDKNHNDSTPVELTVNIAKKPAPELTDDDKPTARENLSYNSTPLPLVDAPVNTPADPDEPNKNNNLPEGITGVKYQVSTDGGKTWSDPSGDVPNATDAGDYVVRTTYVTDDNHTAPDPVETKVTIGPRQVPDDTSDTGVAPLTDKDGEPVDEGGNKLAKDDKGNYYPAKTDPETGNPVRDEEGKLVPDIAAEKTTPMPSVMVVGVGDADDPDHAQGEMKSLPTVDPALAEEIAKAVTPVYDAKAHEPVAYDNAKLKNPEVTADGAKLEEGKDYTVAYYDAADIDPETGLPKDGARPLDADDPDADDYAFDAGEKVAVITFRGNYAGTLTAPVRIARRELHVVTPSASKAYDGTPLVAPEPKVWVDGGSGVSEGAGLVGGQTVEVKVTGSQTARGSSKNTCAVRFKGDGAAVSAASEEPGVLDWLGNLVGAGKAIADEAVNDGLADEGEEPTAKRKNYDLRSDEGTLSVTAASVSDDTGLKGSDKRIEVTPASGRATTPDSATGGVQTTYDGNPLAGPDIYDNNVKDADGSPKKLVEGTDYTVAYYDADGNLVESPTDAGAYTMKVTFMGIYEGEYETTVTVAKAELVVTTPSATKAYDGKALTKADGAKLEGLVNGQTATIGATGSQTAPGSSKNTYKITWDGTAKERNYKVVKENLGTLTVTRAPVKTTTRTQARTQTRATVPKTRDDTSAALPLAIAVSGVILLAAGRSRRREGSRKASH